MSGNLSIVTQRVVAFVSVTVSVLLVSGILAPNASVQTVTLEGLDSEDPAERFEAAMRLSDLRGRGVGAAVKKALHQDSFKDSPESRTAAEFVLWKRSGKRLPPPKSDQDQAPSIILISVDTLRPDHLGCYGYARATSPAIDRLAQRGVLFRNAYSTSSWTLPAHMSLLTSLYPSFHKLDKSDEQGAVRLDDSETTLAQLLKGSGYATAGLVAHTFLDAKWGFDRGFDVYRRYDTHASAQTDRALRWLEWHRFHASRGMAPEPFFLFVHYYDPHETYNAPEPYKHKYTFGYLGQLLPEDMIAFLFADRVFPTPADLQFAIDLYDGEIRYVDKNLGRLFDKVDELGLGSSTAIIFTSDHGEEFKEHESMGHRNTLYEEVVRVPLIVSLPGQLEAGQEVESPVSLVDIVPSVLSLAGAAPLERAQGVDLVPRMKRVGAESTIETVEPRHLFLELGPPAYDWKLPYYRRAVLGGGYKLIHNYLEGGILLRELYSLSGAPEERWNAYGAAPDRVEVSDLEQRLNAFMEEGDAYNPSFRSKNEFEIDEATLEKLRALGYVE